MSQIERADLIRNAEEEVAWLEFSTEQHPSELFLRYVTFRADELEAIGGTDSRAGEELLRTVNVHLGCCSDCRKIQDSIMIY